jgi:hypothetical protein
MTVFVSAAALCPLFSRGAPFPPADYPESAAFRKTIESSWFADGIGVLAGLQAFEGTDALGDRFSVSQSRDRAAGLVSVRVAPGTPAVSGAGIARGTWILDRRLSDGMPESIRLYPVEDSSIFILLKPAGPDPERGKSLLSISVYGAFACRDIPVGLPFVSLYPASLSSIVSMTGSLVPWELLRPDESNYSAVASAVSAVREGLAGLVYLEDGAFDENGSPVYIRDGSPQDPAAVWAAIPEGRDGGGIVGGVNCAGFVKWIVDGIVRPVAGEGLHIAPLKARTSAPDTHFTRTYEESRDLFFALDWTRHLASAVVTLSAGRTVKPDSSGVDISRNLFAGSGVYEKNVGYRTDALLSVLYVLAIREPGHAYLGAVSDERGNPPMRTYHHAAAFFPWFDEEGRFRLSVFENAAEVTPEAFVAANPASYTHLVRVRLPEAGYYQP